jgi:hypothetical protein
MTLDYEDADEVVLGKDLKPGDCVRSKSWSEAKDGNDMGIINATTFILDKRGIELKGCYADEPAYEIYDINSPCDGPMSTRLDPKQKFKVIKSRKDILYTYRTIEHQLLTRSADIMIQRNDLMDIKSDAINRMNNRLNMLKEEVKE